jgi:hypothetical protein
MPKPETLTDEAYQQELTLLAKEIDSVAIIYHTLEELNRLAGEDEAVRNVLNIDALFWLAHRHSSQATMFITLGRIFDPDDENYSIQRLVNATLGNIALFSRARLEKRKLKDNPGKRPEWLDYYLENSWYPAEANDLRHLKKALAPHKKRFDEIYRPIRHTIAHRIMTEDQAGQKYFSKTNREEVGTLIDFLRDLVGVLTNLYWNGHKPELGTQDFTHDNQRIRNSVQSVLKKLVAGSKTAQVAPAELASEQA